MIVLPMNSVQNSCQEPIFPGQDVLNDKVKWSRGDKPNGQTIQPCKSWPFTPSFPCQEKRMSNVVLHTILNNICLANMKDPPLLLPPL